jgi:ribosomal protein S18 acetylase RimI-like enzyme
MSFTLCSLTPLDQSFLWEMLYQAIYVPDGLAPPPREVLERPELAHYVRDWGRPTDLGLLALATETRAPLGAAWLRLFQQPEPGYGYVDDATPELSIAILPASRGQGIGSALLTALLDLAATCFPAVSLSVSPANPALRLYQRLGFAIQSETHSSFTLVKNLKT